MQTCNNEHCQPIVHITVLAMASQPVVRSAHVAHRQSCGSLVIRQVNSKTKKLKIKIYRWWNSNLAENWAHKTRRMCRPHAWTRNWMNNWKRIGRTQTNWNELKRDKFASKLSSVYVSRKYTHIYKLAHKYYNSTSRTNNGTCNTGRMGYSACTRKVPPILYL